MQSEVQQWRFPGDRQYDAEHLWVKREGDTAVVGVTDYLQDTAGSILYVQLPEPGAQVSVGQQACSLEAAKWVGHFNAPVAGRVVAVNEALRTQPALANNDPYGQGWLFKVSTEADSPGWDELMSADTYREFLRDLTLEEEAGRW